MGIFGFGKKETIYFPGCYSSAFFPNIIENYQKILKNLDIDFTFSDDLLCCGGILDETGYEKQFRAKARENLEFFKAKSTKKIITSCALCFKVLSQDYKQMLPEWNIEVEPIIFSILNKLKQDKGYIKAIFYESAIYLDSCYWGRYSGIYEQPRELLSLLGYKLIEMPHNNEEASCDGFCGNLKYTNPILSKKICNDFLNKILKQAKKHNIKKIIVSDSRIYQNLKENIEQRMISEIEILEISELICNALKIKR